MDKSTKDRFFKYVSSEPDENGCLIWLGHRTRTVGTSGGYGTFYANGKYTTAHRFAWEFEHGPIPHRLLALHACDNPPCVNHLHIFIGTQKDNIADARQKHRLATGERHGLHKHPEAIARGERHGTFTHPERIAKGDRVGTAKLSNADVLEIRRSWRSLGRQKLAQKYGVSETLIYQIVKGQLWAHLEPADYSPHDAYRLARHRGPMKLDEVKVREIRRVFNIGNVTKAQLAKKYGVSAPMIGAIISGRSWKHVSVDD